MLSAMKHYCWQLLMIYLLRSNASNALAIGGKKGAASSAGGGVANHLVAVTRGRSAAGNRRRTISNIFDHYGGGSRTSDGGNSSTSSSSSTTTLHQTSYNHNHHHHSERQGQHNRTPLIHKGGYICFRLARKSDVPQIQNCNLGKTYNIHVLSYYSCSCSYLS